METVPSNSQKLNTKKQLFGPYVLSVLENYYLVEIILQHHTTKKLVEDV